jgi:hypothetical protein
MKLILFGSAMTLAVIGNVHALDLGKSAPSGPAPAPVTGAEPAVVPPRTEAAPPITDPQTALRDYINGARNFTPDQMTELLNRTTQTNPGLDMNGAIAKTFRDLASRGDMDGASRFIQSLRPSYDKVRAATLAALSQGNLPQALQLATQLDNLIPGGTNVSFTQGKNGQVNAIVRPENGPAQAFFMTPQQFAQYMQSPNTLFDQSAETGIQNALQQVGAQLVGTNAQPVAAGGLPGYTAQPGVPIARSANQFATGPNYAERQARANAQAAQQRQEARDRAERDHQLQLRAYLAFPMSNQRAQRAALLELLRGQDARMQQERGPDSNACKRFPNLC